MLIGHRAWLDREDFLALAVECLDDGVRPMAALDWAVAVAALDTDRLPCSGSDAQMLRLAAGIAGGVPVDLGDALSGLDRRNAALVAAAVLQATGHPGLSAWPTGAGVR
ncbi:MAG: hypothetical protein ABI438_10860 [Dermatophilaceae bacterium]